MSRNYLEKEPFYWFKVLLDGVFLTVSFLCVYWYRREHLRVEEKFLRFLPLLFLTWLLVTLLSKKFKITERKDYLSLLRPYWNAAIAFILLLTVILYVLGWTQLSFFIVYGTIGIYLVFEIIFALWNISRRDAESRRRRIPFPVVFFLIEVASVNAAFFLVHYYKAGNLFIDERYALALAGICFSWLFVSLVVHRFRVRVDDGLLAALLPFWRSEAVILGLIGFVFFVLARGSMSRLLVFGSAAAFAVLENIIVLAYYGLRRFRGAGDDAAEQPEEGWFEAPKEKTAAEAADDAEETVKEKYRYQGAEDAQEILRKKLERLYLKKHQDVYEFIGKHIDLGRFDIYSSTFMFAGARENIEILEDDSLGFFFNFEKVNDYRDVNGVLTALNRKIRKHGVYAGCFESLEQRRRRIFGKFPAWFAHVYYAVDFAYKRVMPKLPGLKKLYVRLSGGRKHPFSKTEVLGRLYYCGFEAIGLRRINGLFYFIAKKTKEPCADPHPSYGPVFRQRRLGRDGKVLFIFKLRTMHPFAEYIHRYVHERMRLEESGKIKNDFRVTAWGRVFRKAWIDELPMIVNWLKRDLKLVGVRPLSEAFFETYPADLKRERIKFKPGLFPPFYADMPSGIEEVWESERTYLRRYARKPRRTDAAYFFKGMKNILFNHARSK